MINRRNATAFLSTGFTFARAHAADAPKLLRVTVLASGELVVAGSPSSLTELEKKLGELKQGDFVRYERQGGRSNPTADVAALTQALKEGQRRFGYTISYSAEHKGDFQEPLGSALQGEPGRANIGPVLAIGLTAIAAVAALAIYVRRRRTAAAGAGGSERSLDPDDDLWSGEVVSHDHPDVRDPAGLEDTEAKMNAIANVIGYEHNSQIRLLYRESRVIGVWVHTFPQNTTKKDFLMMYGASRQKASGSTPPTGLQNGMMLVHSGAYTIFRAPSGEGFNVRFGE